MDISNNCFLDIDLSCSVVATFILATFSEDINAAFKNVHAKTVTKYFLKN